MNRQKFGILCCILGAVSWGISGTCGEALFDMYSVNSAWLTSIRMTFAGVVLLIWMLIRDRKEYFRILKDKKGILQLVAFAYFGLLLCQFTYLQAINASNAGTATVIQNVSVILVILWTCITTRKRPEKIHVLCGILSMCGVWLLATGGKPGSMVMTVSGLTWGLLSAVGVLLYTVLSKNPVSRWGSIPVTGFGMLIGGLTAFAAVQSWHIPAGLDLRAWIFIAVMASIGTVGAFVLFLQGISMIGPVKATVISCVEPLTASILSALVLHSVFSATDIIAFAMILTTVLLSGFSDRNN